MNPEELAIIEAHLKDSASENAGFILGKTNSRDAVALKHFKEDVSALLEEVKRLNRAYHRACEWVMGDNPDHGFQSLDTWKHYFEADEFFARWDQKLAEMRAQDET